jgi:hypothetical protein
MIAGYAVFVLIMAIYLISFLVRRRNLERDLSTLETIQAENPGAQPKAAGAMPASRGARSSTKKSGGRRRAARRVPRKR